MDLPNLNPSTNHRQGSGGDTVIGCDSLMQLTVWGYYEQTIKLVKETAFLRSLSEYLLYVVVVHIFKYFANKW